MRLAALSFLLFLAADADPPELAIPYFSNVREVRVAQPDRQNFFIVDEELWAHSRSDLGDLRLYDGESPVQYSISEQRAGSSSEEVEAKILDLGNVAGHTEFDLDTQGLAEYDRIRLRLDARDFVAKASVSGGVAPGKATEVELAPSTLYAAPQTYPIPPGFGSGGWEQERSERSRIAASPKMAVLPVPL